MVSEVEMSRFVGEQYAATVFIQRVEHRSGYVYVPRFAWYGKCLGLRRLHNNHR